MNTPNWDGPAVDVVSAPMYNYRLTLSNGMIINQKAENTGCALAYASLRGWNTTNALCVKVG